MGGFFRDVSQAVAQRISTRAFKPDALSEADIREWLNQAQRAPSGGNTQPWRTIVVTGDAKDAVISMAAPVLAANPKGQPTDRPIYPKDLWEPHEARRRKVGEMMYETLGIPREDRAARIAWFANNFRSSSSMSGWDMVSGVTLACTFKPWHCSRKSVAGGRACKNAGACCAPP
jgi:nitroreductase